MLYLKMNFYKIACISILLLGLSLRLVDYDRIPPFGETADEFFYPWAGMTWIQTGVPAAWSWFPAYQNGKIYHKWNTQYRIVSPWLEKPPLYSLLTGSIMLATGAQDLFDVRYETLRLIPIALSLATLGLVIGIASKLFTPTVGLIAGSLYATNPTVVVASRLSLTENLLTPLTLLALFLYLKFRPKPLTDLKVILIAFICALVILTKNVGIAFWLMFVFVFLAKQAWRHAAITFLIGLVAVLIHPFIGWLYDWQLFSQVMQNYQLEFGAQGLPELIFTIFRFPTVGKKDHLLLDGVMLAGYILFYSSPWWLLPKVNRLISQSKTRLEKFLKYITQFDNLFIFIALPFAFIMLLAYLASGEGFSFYGWHVFPLYPFLLILVAKAIYTIYTDFDFFKLLSLLLLIGLSSIRFIYAFVAVENRYPAWQYTFAGLVLITLSSELLADNKRKIVLTILFILLLGVQIYSVINIGQIYPSLPQPLN